MKLALITLTLTAAGAVAAPRSAEEARSALDAHLAKVAEGRPVVVTVVHNDDVNRLFPDTRFFAVRVRDYPIAPPKALKANNLYAVPPAGDVVRLPDEAALRDYLRLHASRVQNSSQAKSAVKAWLTLIQEVLQDGRQEFSLREGSLASEWSDGTRTASATSAVSKGGKGEVKATLAFDPDGRLKKADTASDVRPEGVRPVGPRK
ncbi:MAG: hypothetical protein J2P46_06055 [Zavarzinella sp.]|nr:hypothetical protein [Zavarzinella sp.]